MPPEHWKTTGNVEFLKHDGFDALELKPGDRAKQTLTGNAAPIGVSFRNGTIEFDVDKPWSMGTGIAFRRDKDSSENFEYFYLRPQANCAEAVDCIQYAPQTHGVLLWDVLPQYQAPAPLREGEWNHVKLVVSGQRMNIFVNGAKSPTLKVRQAGRRQPGGRTFAVRTRFLCKLNRYAGCRRWASRRIGEGSILLFSVAVAIATGLLFGLAPALQATRLDLFTALKAETGAVMGASASARLRKALVTAQVALSFLLLVGAGLFAKTLGNLKDARTGMEKIGNVITFCIEPALAGYTVPRMRNFNTEVLREIRATPGVKSAAYTYNPLLLGGRPT